MLDCIVTASMIFSYFLTVLDNAILIISMLPFAATIMATPLNLFIAMIFYTFFMYLIHEQFQEMYELWEIYMETGDIDVALYIICGTIGVLGGTLLGGATIFDDFLKIKLFNGGSTAAKYSIDINKLNFSKTVQGNLNRSYQELKLLINEIIESKAPMSDPRGTSALYWKVEGYFNGSKGSI